MAQEIKLIARTVEVGDNCIKTSDINNELTALAGRTAGICYMPGDYLDKGINDYDKAIKRAESAAKNGHQSVYEHGHLTFTIKTNKMMAMILNSLGVYSTSEKSARYTQMNPETEREHELYTKWKNIFHNMILDKYSDIDDDTINKRIRTFVEKELNNSVEVPEFKSGGVVNCDKHEIIQFVSEQLKDQSLPSYKLAQENARYMLSVFTPTVMAYTISFRQVFLILDYFKKLSNNLGEIDTNFAIKLKPYIDEFISLLADEAGNIRFHDNKNQYIRFLEAQHVKEKLGDKEVDLRDLYKEPKKQIIGDSYTVNYFGSLAMLAQAQRHRTIKYTMYLNEAGEYGFYIPKIIKDTCYEKEWLDDISSIYTCIPQGTLVRITEQGIFEDFVLKCKERMCGRAQLEIMIQTKKLVNKFINNRNNLCPYNKLLLDDITCINLVGDQIPVARCLYGDFSCTEGCQWGANEALTREI